MSEKKSKGQELLEKLSYKKRNFFEISSEKEIDKMYEYCDGYKDFLDKAKTEREATAYAIAAAEKKGYKPYNFGDKLVVGGKYYYNNHDKSIAVFKIGKNALDTDGVRIIAAHIDSPRIDLKQNPMYEDSGFCLLKTHYYGGIKKYQWTTIPLALHGVVVLKDGSKVTVEIGEKPGDPVFYINDLLPHLAKEQAQQVLGKAIAGEDLNIVVGGLPYPDEDVKEKIKLNVLSELNERYGMTEEDFLSAEIAAVPAFNARDIGFDRAFIGAYGHDDRVCAYPTLTAILDSKDDDRTVLAILVDKEEIGSEGNTGMQCCVFNDIIDAIAKEFGVSAAKVRAASKCLSTDVTAGYDPNFASVFEKKNAAIVSCGAAMNKFTGAGGKSGSNDASAEFVGEVRKIFADNDICWQTSELGKVDIGGGGTIAKYVAKLNIDTVDMGVPVISMHAPYELVSKADVYSTYLAFSAFIK